MARKKSRSQQQLQVTATTSSSSQPAPQQKKKKKSKGRGRKARNRGAGNFQALLKRNPYLASLLYPEQHLDAGVPDSGMYPTARFPITWDTVLSTDAQGVGCLVISPGLIYRQSTQTSGLITGWTNQTAWPNNTVANAFAAATLAMRFRPVSMSVNCEFVGSTQSDGGSIATASAPVLTGNLNTYLSSSGADPVAFVAAFPDSLTLPLRNGARRLWKPSSPQEYFFTDATAASTSGVWVQNSSGALTGISGYAPILVAVSGGQASTGLLRVRVDMNLEYIPATDFYAAIQPEQSKADPIALAEAENLLGDMVLATPIQGSIWDTAMGVASQLTMGIADQALNSVGVLRGAGRIIGGTLASSVSGFMRRRGPPLLTY